MGVNKKALVWLIILLAAFFLGYALRANQPCMLNIDKVDKFVNEDISALYKITGIIDDDTPIGEIRYLYNYHPVGKNILLSYVVNICSRE